MKISCTLTIRDAAQTSPEQVLVMLTKSRLKSLWLLLIFVFPVAAQDDLPSCPDRPLVVLLPRIESRLWCIEHPIQSDSGDALIYTAIAFDDEGTLYATSPQAGELIAFEDSNDDGLPDQPRVAAEGLRLPAGLAFADGVLYIVGDGAVYAYQDGNLRTIADDLPAGRGFFTSGIAVHEGILYIGIPAPCDVCVPDDPLRGTVLRMTLNGEEREVIARGLRYPAALTVHQGQLWVTDSARDGLWEASYLDEFNVIDLNSDDVPHFGWPYCVGLENTPDVAGDFDCADATAPTIALATGSIPLDLHSYQSETFPFLTDDLVFVLGGSLYQNPIRGYQVSFLDAQADSSTIIETILPHDRTVAGVDRVTYNPEVGYESSAVEVLNRRGAGIWPQRIFGVAESPEGYLYISAGGGDIYALRENGAGDPDPCDIRDCDFPVGGD